MLSIGDDCYWEQWLAPCSGIITDHRAPWKARVHIIFARLEDDCHALLDRSVTDVCVQVHVCGSLCVRETCSEPNQGIQWIVTEFLLPIGEVIVFLSNATVAFNITQNPVCVCLCVPINWRSLRVRGCTVMHMLCLPLIPPTVSIMKS